MKLWGAHEKKSLFFGIFWTILRIISSYSMDEIHSALQFTVFISKMCDTVIETWRQYFNEHK